MIGKVSFKFLIGFIWQRKEAIIWMTALIFLAVSNPADHHYTLCPLDNMGISYCPGCGLGRSIGYFFRLDLESSFLSHPLGIPAIILLIYRSFKILFRPVAMNFLAASSEVSVITDGLTRRLECSRPKGRGIDPVEN